MRSNEQVASLVADEEDQQPYAAGGSSVGKQEGSDDKGTENEMDVGYNDGDGPGVATGAEGIEEGEEDKDEVWGEAIDAESGKVCVILCCSCIRPPALITCVCRNIHFQVYYYNRLDGSTTWDMPDGYPHAAAYAGATEGRIESRGDEELEEGELDEDGGGDVEEEEGMISQDDPAQDHWTRGNISGR